MIHLLLQSNISLLFHVHKQTKDEYIYMKKIGKPSDHCGNASNREDTNGPSNSGVSKFDRYRHQDDDDEMDEGIFLLGFFTIEHLILMDDSCSILLQTRQMKCPSWCRHSP